MPLQATAIHNFWSVNFENPALLSRVKHQEIISGVDCVNPRAKFKGTTVFEGAGTARSSQYDYLAYGMYAFRYNPKLVLGVAVTRPEYVNFNYGTKSIVRVTGTKTLDEMVRLTPRFSYQCTEKLAVGAGFDVNYLYNGQLNFFLPEFGEIKNKNMHFWYGFNVGIYYTFNPKNFLNAAYFSGRVLKEHGFSEAENGARNNHYTLNPPSAPEFYAQWIRICNEKLMLAGKVIYSQWSICKEFKFLNTVAGDFFEPLHWKDTWTFEILGKYTINTKWELISAVEFATNFARPKYNTVAFPGSEIGVLRLGFSYQITDCLKSYIIFARGQFLHNQKIDNVTYGDKGHIRASVNYLGIQLAMSW